jgi:hypothetical protein
MCGLLEFERPGVGRKTGVYWSRNCGGVAAIRWSNSGDFGSIPKQGCKRGSSVHISVIKCCDVSLADELESGGFIKNIPASHFYNQVR